jgi:hypothetical protein
MTKIDHRKEMNRVGAEAARKAIKAYAAANPEASRMKAVVQVNAYRARPKGFSDWPVKLIGLLIRNPAVAAKPNAYFAAWLGERYDGYPVSEALLYKALSPTQRVAIDKALGDAALPGRTKAGDTFSVIRQRWPSIRGLSEGVRTGLVEVTFTDESVVIGGKSYTVDQGQYRRIRQGGSWVRVDVLERLLLGQE